MTTLFNDIELFTPGNRGKIIFDLPDAEVMLIDNFFSKEESDHYYATLLADTQWREYQMPMYDKVVTAPRMICWYEDNGTIGDNTAPELTDDLKTIRNRLEEVTAEKFNAVLLNLYRSGQDGVAWHSDKTGKSGKNPLIASVTFGETRLFRLRHKFRPDIKPVEIPLYHGTFLLMAGMTNSFWEHQVPKTSRNIGQRINLTFRQVRNDPKSR